MKKFLEQRVEELEQKVVDLRNDYRYDREQQQKEITELKLIVHELRKPSTVEEEVSASSVEDTIEFEGKQYRKVDRLAREGDVVVFQSDNIPEMCLLKKGKPYHVAPFMNKLCVEHNEWNHYEVYKQTESSWRTPETVDVYEPITQDVQHQTVECAAAKTANELRGEIIEKAKGFVEENKKINGCYKVKFGYVNRDCVNTFVVNEEKRTIVSLLKGFGDKHIYARGIAKCNPSDVFNEHIGKAIALGRALGLDVSEFEGAVQPTWIVTGMIAVDSKGDIREVKEGHDHDGYPVAFANDTSSTLKIINDTNAIYSEVNE